MNAIVIDCLLKLHVSKFLFLEVRFGRGSSTEIETADVERIICSTVVTFKKNYRRKEKHFSAMCTCFVFDVDRNRDLHNITMNQKRCLFSFNCKFLQKLMMLAI